MARAILEEKITFKTKVQNIQQLTRVFTKAFDIQGLKWKFQIEKKIACQEENRMEDAVAVWLHCDIPNELNDFMCGARAKITLVSFKDSKESKQRCLSKVYNSRTKIWGYHSFIEWEKLFINGFVRDDAVLFKIELKVGRLEHKNFGSLTFTTIEDKYEGEEIVEKLMKLILNKIDDKFVATNSTKFKFNDTMFHIELYEWFHDEQFFFIMDLYCDTEQFPDDWSCELSAKLKFVPANADFVPIKRFKRLQFSKNEKFMSVGMVVWPKLKLQFVKNDSIEMMLELKVEQH